MNRLDMNELGQVNGGTAPVFGYWRRAIISAADPETGLTGFYQTPEKSPENIRFQLKNGDELYVYSESNDPGWVYAKTRGVVTGYVESQYVTLL